MLGGILAFWLLMRVAIWQPPFLPASLAVLPLDGAEIAETIVGDQSEPSTPEYVPAEPFAPYSEPQPPVWQMSPPIEKPLPVTPLAYSQFGAARTAVSRRGFAGASNLVSHAYLLSAAYRSNPAAADRSVFTERARPAGSQVPIYALGAAEEMRDTDQLARWTMDAWAMWRQDNASPLLSGRPSYGRSQVGAVMRYNLAPSSGHAPQLHLRASSALEGRQERELAFGASARPIPGIPVRLAAEARVSETDRRTEPRVAAYAVSEFPPIDLPAGFSGEAYVQGGYVTGDFATPFVDGQARITRELAGTDDFRLSAGAGAWGGAQEDAQRLDVGPSAGVNFRIGPARGRVSADYRFRVAGDAQPSSGPALTLSAGF